MRLRVVYSLMGRYEQVVAYGPLGFREIQGDPIIWEDPAAEKLWKLP